ncbi:hypothetical protein BHE74_00023306 [Ensete ventricosum]|nr:hypothetical protein GW17_00014565 [Ensete ventricosum]RWW69130.1 hypothetical protein BHE74_00023306 [Ensete ventricosum]RZR78341.1 hypothetical protein BHM03_00003634 [Ensete ventricosum]
MVRGTLEVLLVSAKGLVDVDFFGRFSPHRVALSSFCSLSWDVFGRRSLDRRMTPRSGKMDPYAVLMYRSQEQKSSTASVEKSICRDASMFNCRKLEALTRKHLGDGNILRIRQCAWRP